MPARRRGAAFGIKQAAAPLATLLAGLAIPVFALTLGWRAAFLAACLLFPLVVAIAICLVMLGVAATALCRPGPQANAFAIVGMVLFGAIGGAIRFRTRNPVDLLQPGRNLVVHVQADITDEQTRLTLRVPVP